MILVGHPPRHNHMASHMASKLVRTYEGLTAALIGAHLEAVDLVLPQPGRDVHPVTLHAQEVAELPPLGLQQIHAASLGVKHLVPDNNMVIMVVDTR